MNSTYIEPCKSLQNEDDENYEELIQVYLSQRHYFSASLPPPCLTELLIDQIKTEASAKQKKKEFDKFGLKQSLLQMINPGKFPFRILESPSSQAMVEIAEVTSSDEQSPIQNFSPMALYESDDEVYMNISQEIKANDKRNIPVMKNKFFPISEKFRRNRNRMMKIINCSKVLGNKKEFRVKAERFLIENPNKIYAIVFSPVNKEKIGIFLIHNEKAVKVFGDELPDCIPLSKIGRKFTFDFTECSFLENSLMIDGFDFNEELLS